MARILVTGASGMLGSTLVRRWASGTHSIFATGGRDAAWDVPVPYRAADLRSACDELIAWAQPEVIVHCAANTNVDACERDPEGALETNGRSVARLVAAAPSARLIYISSDAVMGDATRPARESTPPQPLTAYARAKLDGEQHLRPGRDCAVRTTPVGRNVSPERQSFAEWIVRSLRKGQEIGLFTDVRFSPIAAPDLADELLWIAEHETPVLLHVTGEDTTKHEFGHRLAAALGLPLQLIKEGSIHKAGLQARRVTDQTLDCTIYRAARPLPDLARTIATLAQELEE